ncbi:hypothetical protein BASA81_018352 [Batrachochytrium salamandrivorans]|nr:hypothetical protein BASA81_018352 [Batrachochytrium salamandrivorans]
MKWSFNIQLKRKEQSRCVELVSYFLLNFPLERQRLEEHVQLIVKNITHYEHETGRMGGLKLLTSILNRFPAELIDHFCDLFFITLCLVLQNDDSNQVKKETAKVLGTLFTKLTKSKFSTTVVSFMNKWFDHPKSLALACQLAGLLPNKQLFHEKLLQVVAEVRDDDNALYQALVALERALTNDAVDVERVPDLKALLLYEDLWVRQVCSRMVSSRLEAHGQLDGIEGFDLVLVLVDQLDSDQISDELAPLVLHNLVLIIQACKPAWFRGKNEIPLAWMINKLCYIASRPEPLDLGLKNRRRRVVFQFFHAVFTQSHMGMDDKLVKAVVKTLNVIHVSGLERLDPLAELKDQIVELMKQSIGVEALAAAMGKDKKFKTERRREKRAQRDVERVMPTKRIKRNV